MSGRKSSTGSEFTWYKTINVHIIPANITSFVSMLLLKFKKKENIRQNLKWNKTSTVILIARSLDWQQQAPRLFDATILFKCDGCNLCRRPIGTIPVFPILALVCVIRWTVVEHDEWENCFLDSSISYRCIVKLVFHYKQSGTFCQIW